MKSSTQSVPVSRAQSPAKQQNNSQATTPAIQHAQEVQTHAAKPAAEKKKSLAEVLAELNKDEIKNLNASVTLVKELDDSSVGHFYTKVGACAKMRKILGSAYPAYVREQLGYEHAHAHRLAVVGDLIARWYPCGDGWKVLTGESHFRPLLGLEAAQQDAVLATLTRWKAMAASAKVSPRMVQAAVSVVKPPTAPRVAKNATAELVTRACSVIDEQKKQLPADAGKEVGKLFDVMRKKVAKLGGPRRQSGIDWTTATWNPLHGCTRASAGCDHCYAAELTATRLASKYPGLAKAVTVDGETQYRFTGKILLAPEHLGVPLQDLVPKRYFVNSMSDLFHKNVPDEFIEQVFDVMEKAPWHTFQVLTKRPERMAAFTTKRYAAKEPPAHIWLGASTENQESYDERWPELLKVRTAVRWLSLEPLLGPVKLKDTDKLDWAVVGGESGSDRTMKKAWATALRDQCKKADVPFFFKQWSDYGEDGKKVQKPKKDGLTPPALDGVVHDAYPVPASAPTAGKEAAQG